MERYTFVCRKESLPVFFFVLALLVFQLWFVPSLFAKHIIITYDISKSMYELRNRRFMDAQDVQRLNDYVSSLLFRGFPTAPLSPRDTIVKAYQHPALYQQGDVVSCVLFGAERIYRLQRQAVHQIEFAELLPDPSNLGSSFHEMDTLLDQMVVEMYNRLYRKSEPTYWILVSDEDEDISLVQMKDPEAKRQLALISNTYTAPTVYELLVNRHVTIRVHEILEVASTRKGVFLASPDVPESAVHSVRFFPSSDPDRGYVSEPVLVNTRNPGKEDFKLGSAHVEVMDSNGTQLHEQDIDLSNNAPPREFRISLPSDKPQLRSLSNQLEIAIDYQYEGSDLTSPAFTLPYQTIVDTVFLASAADPVFPLKELHFSRNAEGKEYRSEAVVLSTESTTPERFALLGMKQQVLTRDGSKIDEASVPLNNIDIGKAFHLSLDQTRRGFDRGNNNIVLTVEYEFAGEPKSLSATYPYKVVKPMTIWPLILIVAIVLGVLLAFALVKHIWPRISGAFGQDVDVYLSELDENGNSTGHTDTLTLSKGDVLSFNSTDQQWPYFDVDSDATLTYEDSVFRLDDTGDEVTEVLPGDTFEVTNRRDEMVRIYIDWGSDTNEDDEDQPVEEDWEQDLQDDDDILRR